MKEDEGGRPKGSPNKPLRDLVKQRQRVLQKAEPLEAIEEALLPENRGVA